jgi:hypothetical protein
VYITGQCCQLHGEILIHADVQAGDFLMGENSLPVEVESVRRHQSPTIVVKELRRSEIIRDDDVLGIVSYECTKDHPILSFAKQTRRITKDRRGFTLSTEAIRLNGIDCMNIRNHSQTINPPNTPLNTVRRLAE